MKVNSNDLHIASCAVHHDSATNGIRVADMQVACVSCWLLAKFVAAQVVYSVQMSYDAACPRCVSSSYIHSCMPGKDADMLYSRLNLVLPYVCHKAFQSGCADIDTVDAETKFDLMRRPSDLSRCQEIIKRSLFWTASRNLWPTEGWCC